MGLLDEVIAATGLGGSPQAQQRRCALRDLELRQQPASWRNLRPTENVSGQRSRWNRQFLGRHRSNVSADQLQNVLHSGALQQAAQSAGIDPSQLVSMMTTFLPHIVDKLTPNALVPDNSALQQMMKGLAA